VRFKGSQKVDSLNQVGFASTVFTINKVESLAEIHCDLLVVSEVV
jgi:hypothetical protein